MAINFNQLRTLTGHFQESAGTAGQIELSTGFAGNALAMVAGGSLGLDVSVTRTAQTFAVGGGAWTFGADELLVTGVPTAANSIPNKLYVDNLISGVSWKGPVLTSKVFDVANRGSQVIVLGTIANGDSITIDIPFVFTATYVFGTNFTDEATLASQINAGLINSSVATTLLPSISANLVVVSYQAADIRIWSSAPNVQFLDFSASKGYDKTSADLINITASTGSDTFGERMSPVISEARLVMDTDKQYVYDADTSSWVAFSTGSLSAGNGVSIVSNVVSAAGGNAITVDAAGINVVAGAGLIATAGDVAIDTAGVINSMMATDSVSTLNIIALNVTAAKLAVDSVLTSKILNANVTPAKLSFSWKSETILASAGTFSAGFTTLPIAGAAPSTDGGLSQGFMLMRNGIDDMDQVVGAPSNAFQWEIVGGTIKLFGDQTLSGDSYKIRYMA